MDYKKTTSLIVPTQKWEWIGDYLVARFLEMFWTDELITQYIDSSRSKFDKEKYTHLITWVGDSGIISVKDYQEFLDNLRSTLPNKFRKKWTAGKPWFDNVMPIIDLWMGPMTFEQGKLLAEGRKSALTK